MTKLRQKTNQSFGSIKPLLCLLSMVSVGSIPMVRAQVFNLMPILAEKIEPVYLQDPQIHAINNQGVMLGSLESIHDPASRHLFLISSRSGDFQVTLLDEYPLCTPMDINDQNTILINAQMPSASNIQTYVVRGVRGARPQRVFGTADQESTGSKIHGNKVALTISLAGLPDRSDADENPYRGQTATFETPSIADKGLIATTGSSNIEPGGFPIAQWYNLNSTVTDFNEKGHYCGTSQGYTLGANAKDPYPYFATEDSVYRLLDGYQGEAVAMNEHDQIIGTWKHPLTGKNYGFFYDRDLLKESEFDWLDMLVAIPTAINEDGIVVGHAQDTAFVMIDKEFVNKQAVLADFPGTWQKTRILDINDNLEIIGNAKIGNRQVLFYCKLAIDY